MRSVLLSIAIFATGAVVLGAVNLGTTEVQPSVGIILLLTALLTFRTPSFAPLWLIGTAATIPLSLVIGPLVRVIPRDPPADIWTTAVALIPAALGTGVGIGLRALTAPRSG